MTQSTDDLLPEGLSDRLPKEAAVATHAMRAVLGTMDAHGYDRVRPPLVEFERSMAERMGKTADSDSPRRMFRFVDPASLRTLALRSDMTVQVGRMAATSLAAAPRPLRLCYAGEVALIKADQLDPARQKLQLGAELIGSDTVEAAGEIVSLAIEALEAAGAAGISVDFTLPDLVDVLSDKAMPLASDQIGAVRRELDTKDAGGLAAVPGGNAYLPLLYATGAFEDAIERLCSIDAGGALTSRIEGLKAIASRVGGRARVTLDPTERHGFEYQSWFGFTIYADGVRGALGRGGTYAIGGSNEAATGFSLYIDALIDILSRDAQRKALFLPMGHDAPTAAALRAEGWRTVAALSADDDGQALGCTHVLEGGTTTAY
ncbi:ATP phosphoribosyltransferase regulatory subunit [Pontixanthobacter gangjinensis]|uniref:ATP phosphoribosyltransferase regulatory subunit n=1 Tax=Pontixanthobacter gangjinensis TaxID=1028742 RepID=A0A6I4SL27_9SPHN|nr:ATP phosphoribosyltransferase regulatory subunit [Pontixanthobacter gangjinensis]MXO56469.1 ATP phosphoribosyltransferase regulatory subunit [Pontixanthobacter gangjinensis]